MTALIILTFILAPAYVFHFSLLHLPTDVLMMWVFLVWIVFIFRLIIKKQLSHFLTAARLPAPKAAGNGGQVKKCDRKILLFVCLFFLSGLIGLFVKTIDRAKFGQFIVLFLQPISLFFITSYVVKNNAKTKDFLLLTFYFLLAIAGAYAIIQYFTLLGLPPAWWGNSVEPKRALAFFVHPNFYALWAAPLLALLIPDLSTALKTKTYKLKTFLWLLGAAGLLFSFSRAGWLGLAAAVGIYLIIAADAKIKKLVLATAIVLTMAVLAVPNLRYRLILPFYGEKSSVSRFSLWNTGLKGVKESPILGLGLTGFSRQWLTLNTDPGLTDTHNYPHNIFLDFWVETGLLGLISFLGIAYIFIRDGFKNRTNILKLGVCLFLIALITQGQVDNPYFKNDLAMVFWMILALA